MKIFYKKENGNFAGAGCIEKLNNNGKFEQELSDDKYNFIEIEESEWKGFLKTNSNKLIKIVDGKLEASEPILTLEQLKTQKISPRKVYRKQMFQEWFDDVENMPQEIKTKLKNEKDEIEAIKNATEETINNY